MGRLPDHAMRTRIKPYGQLQTDLSKTHVKDQRPPHLQAHYDQREPLAGSDGDVGPLNPPVNGVFPL